MSEQEQQYQLSGDQFKADPFPTFAKMRNEEPIYRLELNVNPGTLWEITNHEYAEAVLR